MGCRLLTTRWRWRTGSGSADPARPLWPCKDSAEERRLREAARIFAGLGALAAARIAGQKMRQLGLRSIPAGPRIAARAPPLGLTRREREALDLICAGHTNAQIAARLFISAKAAGHHVSAWWRNWVPRL